MVDVPVIQSAFAVTSGSSSLPPPPLPPPQAVRLNRHKIRKIFFTIIKFVFNMVYDRSNRNSIKAFVDKVPAVCIAHIYRIANVVQRPFLAEIRSLSNSRERLLLVI